MHHTLQQLEEEVTLPYGVPAIICSIPGIEQATNGLGVSDYLIKPIARDALLSALKHLERQIHTILVVDDEPDALKLFRRMLTSAEENYRVLRASNGRQALENHAKPVTRCYPFGPGDARDGWLSVPESQGATSRYGVIFPSFSFLLVILLANPLSATRWR